jgi:dihydroorotate dehydrogenase
VKLYANLIFPLLAKTDAERAHDITLRLLEIGQGSRVGRNLLRLIAGSAPGKETSAGGVYFPNILGIAAGFDKDARVVQGLTQLGFGHVEIGTVTPETQAGNPKPRITRIRSDKALINRMGFPNEGAQVITERLKRLSEGSFKATIGVSIGKQKDTPLSDAVQDYVAVMRMVYPFADYLAINISSPNTPGLRDLHQSSYLDELLTELVLESSRLGSQHSISSRPIFVKLSPDLTQLELDAVLDVSISNRINGVIAANTTTSRKGLNPSAATAEGGLSGRPLMSKSNEMIAYIRQQTHGDLPIIGVGGVFSAADVREKLDAGASLVQVYTGLVYEGPGLAGRILRDLDSTK